MKINIKNILYIALGLILGFIFARLNVNSLKKVKIPVSSPTITSQIENPMPTTSPNPVPVKVPNTYYNDAVKKAKQLGFTVWPDDSDKEDFNTQHLNVLIGYCTGAVTGTCQEAFFFYDGKFVGTDIPDGGESAGIMVDWQSYNTIALDYKLYNSNDPMCCHSGGWGTVRFYWDGTKIENLDPIPSEDERL